MKMRSSAQSKLFHAMVMDVQRVYPLVPWRRALALEAWKRHFLKVYVLEARIEAFGAHLPDPFPVRPVPSSSLSSEQANELIECTYWYVSEHLNLVLE